jgi:hypothetical protein
MDRIHLIRDEDKSRALVENGINFPVLQNAGKFVTSWANINYWRGTLLHRVSWLVMYKPTNENVHHVMLLVRGPEASTSLIPKSTTRYKHMSITLNIHLQNASQLLVILFSVFLSVVLQRVALPKFCYTSLFLPDPAQCSTHRILLHVTEINILGNRHK